MAITFGSITSSVASATAITRSVNHTCATGTNLLLVRVALRGASTSPSAVTVTYGGIVVPLVSAAAATNSSSRAYSGIFALANPSTGVSLELRASWTNSANCVLTATNVAGCNTTPVAGVNATGSNASPTLTTSDSTAGAVAVDSLVVNSGRTLTTGAGSTAAYAQFNTSTGANDLAHRAASKSSAVPVTLSWSLDSASNWAASACVLLPSQAISVGNFLAFF